MQARTINYVWPSAFAVASTAAAESKFNCGSSELFVCVPFRVFLQLLPITIAFIAFYTRQLNFISSREHVLQSSSIEIV